MQQTSQKRRQKEKGIAPVWSNLKPNNSSRIGLRIFVVHNSEAQVVVDEISFLFTL